MFKDNHRRTRKCISVDCKDLLIDPQKFSFSLNGKFLAVGGRDGCRISVFELITDSKNKLHELILTAICYRGFFSANLKAIMFSPDNNFLMVTSDAGKIFLFEIGNAIKSKNNLKTVRKKEIKACLVI